MSISASRLPEQDEIGDTQEYLRECLDLDPEQLNEEFCKIPGAIAWWNARFADASKRAAVAKLDYEREWARLYVLLSAPPDEEEEEEALPRGRKKPKKRTLTVDGIKARCDEDPELYQLAVDVALAEAEKIRLRGICEAVLAKRDMLQSLGAKLREELHADVTLRGNALTG